MSQSVASASPAPASLKSERESRVNLLALCLLALGIGLATGVGAVALRALIGLIHNLCYFGKVSIFYDANVLEAVSRFGDWIFLSPVLGGLLVVFIVNNFAPEAKGHGVPEVMDAIYYKRGDIRWQVAVVKSLASALSIGTGAAVGREGPIIQIGAALGSTFSQMLGLSTAQKITLLSAGAGAGIAATFNTPLGGVLFALEILLPEVSNRTFLPVVIATGAATLLGRVLVGPDPAFSVPAFVMPSAREFNIEQAIAYVSLGGFVGVGAWLFIRVLVALEDGFPKIPGGAYVRGSSAIAPALQSSIRETVGPTPRTWWGSSPSGRSPTR
jgi:CIC family chloride channel protein